MEATLAIHQNYFYWVISGVVKDCRDHQVKIYPDILKILNFCRDHQIPMAVASYSPETAMYIGLMKLLDIHKYFVQFEIYSKNLYFVSYSILIQIHSLLLII